MVGVGMVKSGGVPKDSAGASRRLSVVIPVYRSEKILPELIRRLEPVLRNVADAC